MSVTNLNSSLNFYKILGFKINYERPEDKFAFISLDGSQIMLQEISKDDKIGSRTIKISFWQRCKFSN